MAIPITNSQGTKVYVCALGTSVTDAAAIATAKSAGQAIGCLQDLGSISTSRSVQEYACLSSDETAKSFGSLSLGNMNIQLLFDADDATGQDALRDMYLANEQKLIIVELNDQITPTTGNPTYYTFNGGISSEEVAITKDNAVMYNVTLEITSVPTFVPAT